MKKNVIKLIVFIILGILIYIVVPNFKKDYFPPSEIEESRCKAFLSWLRESLECYNDEFYDSVNKTYPKIEKIDDNFIRLLKDKNYVDINKYQGHGFHTSYSAEPGRKCSYSLAEDDSIFCKYHTSDEFRRDQKMEDFWLSIKDHFAIIAVVGIIIYFV